MDLHAPLLDNGKIIIPYSCQYKSIAIGQLFYSKWIMAVAFMEMSTFKSSGVGRAVYAIL